MKRGELYRISGLEGIGGVIVSAITTSPILMVVPHDQDSTIPDNTNTIFVDTEEGIKARLLPDKVTAISAKRIREKYGVLTSDGLEALNDALARSNGLNTNG